jgi:hypothetical protein
MIQTTHKNTPADTPIDWRSGKFTEYFCWVANGGKNNPRAKDYTPEIQGKRILNFS